MAIQKSALCKGRLVVVLRRVRPSRLTRPSLHLLGPCSTALRPISAGALLTTLVRPELVSQAGPQPG